ncbi:hypothetical protein L1077_13375 [Pseudoalteromonas luteoviolacea]|uniref:hypothetical protein n=1 Tax=Pseudoalteromonas luteoviolacea TaxID=43657 RepID=UPI001F2CEEB3|nr:hypothetical protein [Pseudoalteromonas luteoviolacea]MCF6440422.1 hypothetical protein [Pseudoalteromonas luteoviolacea]
MITIFRRCLLCVFILFLAGCANTTTVHIYAKYIPDESLIQLKQALEENGFNVETNTLAFPTSISRNTMLHSLMLQDPNAVETAKHTANKSGFKISDIQALKEGNHWYTKNAIAIYPFPKDKQNSPLLKADLAQHFKTTSCDSEYKLKLHKNGAYELSGQNISEENKGFLKGTWHYVQYPYMELRPYKGISWSRYFEIHQLVTRDKISEIELIQLKPIEKHYVSQHCVYEFGTRL